VRIALPFQTVETVNESAKQRQYTLDLFSAGRGLREYFAFGNAEAWSMTTPHFV